MPNHYIISVDQATSEQLNSVHEIIKQHANGWWHHFINVWIVGGGETAQFWRDQIKEAIKTGEASALVLKLPESIDERNWSLFGVNSGKRGAWLHKNYKQ